jgi:CRISPR-associated protein Csc1
MFSNQVISYDVVNMPPVSLIQNVQMRGQYYYFEKVKDVRLPVNISYRFRN